MHIEDENNIHAVYDADNMNVFFGEGADLWCLNYCDN